MLLVWRAGFPNVAAVAPERYHRPTRLFVVLSQVSGKWTGGRSRVRPLFAEGRACHAEGGVSNLD